jgi:hypothetical protein
MTRTLVHRICSFALVVALGATFVGAALLKEEHFQRVSQAEECPRASGSYGELPPVW